jgi:hypothetical protein
VTVGLDAVDVPGISGTATLTASGDATSVVMMLTGPGVTGDHPTHIHTGTCDDFDPNPLYPLTTVTLDPIDDQGQSTTDVDDVPLVELLAEDYVILVHRSDEELTTYLVCGEIQEASRMPATGVGSARPSAAEHGFLALGAAAVILVAAALGVRARAAKVGS